MKRNIAVVTTAAALFLGVGGYASLFGADNPPTPAPKTDDQMMHRAHRNLLQARHDLQSAEHDFAGHRVKARQLTEDALKEVDAGLGLDPANDKLTDQQVAEAEKNYPKNKDASAKEKTAEAHRIMRSALTELTAAKANLTNAPHDYKGHRANAEKLVDQAVEEINAGLASADKK